MMVWRVGFAYLCENEEEDMFDGKRLLSSGTKVRYGEGCVFSPQCSGQKYLGSYRGLQGTCTTCMDG